jgi:hypothetical protein
VVWVGVGVLVVGVGVGWGVGLVLGGGLTPDEFALRLQRQAEAASA